MPKTEQPRSQKIGASYRRLQGFPNKKQIRAARGDYGADVLGDMGIIHAIERDFDPNGYGQENWQNIRMEGKYGSEGPKKRPRNKSSVDSHGSSHSRLDP